MWCGIFELNTTESGIAIPGKKYWSNLPYYILVEEFYNWHKSTEFENMYSNQYAPNSWYLGFYRGSIKIINIT